MTGATGFIGKGLVRRLTEGGSAVRVLCRRGSEVKIPADLRARVEVAEGDMTDEDSLAAAVRNAQRVFHCAGEVNDWGPLARFEAVNVVGTRRLARLAARADARRFVHLSSFVVFGVPPPPSMDDATPYGEATDPYTRTKIEGEKAVLLVGRETGLEVVVLRPTVVYGRGGTWLEEPLAMMRRRMFFLLGKGRGTCHGCYIENLLDAMVLAADHPRAVGRAYLVSDGDPVSFREYFAGVARLAGCSSRFPSLPLPVARALALSLETFARLRRSEARPLLTRTAIALVTTASTLSTGRIEDELGYHPRFTFDAAIRDLHRKPEAAAPAA